MAQFDVYDNPVAAARSERPYVLELQSDLLSAMASTAVVPLVLPGLLPLRFERLTPEIVVHGRPLRLSMPEVFSLPRRFLGAAVTNNAADRDAIIAAVDHLILGI